MSSKRLRSAAVVLIAVLLGIPGPATALIGNTRAGYGVDGSFRTTLFGLRNYDNDRLFGEGNRYDVLSQSALRLILAGRPKDWLAFQFQVVQGLVVTTTPTPAGEPTVLHPAVRRYRFFRDTWNWLEDSDAVASLSPERYNVRLIERHLELTIGRQAIMLSKSYLWTPLDIFGPFDPQQFDRDYKESVDALRASLATGENSGAEIIAALGRQIETPTRYDSSAHAGCDWYGSALVGRLYTAVAGFDLSLLGGKTYGGALLGFGAVGEVGFGIQVRSEITYTWEAGHQALLAPLPDSVVEDSLQAVASLGRRWQNSFDLEFEYFFNGAGEARNNLVAGRLRQISGGTQQWGRNYIGATASYDFLPILVGRIVGIVSITDSSGFLEPILTWSLAENWDLLLGAAINLGKHPTDPADPAVAVVPRSEYGTYPSSLFLEGKAYF